MTKEPTNPEVSTDKKSPVYAQVDKTKTRVEEIVADEGIYDVGDDPKPEAVEPTYSEPKSGPEPVYEVPSSKARAESLYATAEQESLAEEGAYEDATQFADPESQYAELGKHRIYETPASAGPKDKGYIDVDDVYEEPPKARVAARSDRQDASDDGYAEAFEAESPYAETPANRTLTRQSIAKGISDIVESGDTSQEKISEYMRGLPQDDGDEVTKAFSAIVQNADLSPESLSTLIEKYQGALEEPIYEALDGEEPDEFRDFMEALKESGDEDLVTALEEMAKQNRAEQGDQDEQDSGLPEHPPGQVGSAAQGASPAGASSPASAGQGQQQDTAAGSGDKKGSQGDAGEKKKDKMSPLRKVGLTLLAGVALIALLGFLAPAFMLPALVAVVISASAVGLLSKGEDKTKEKADKDGRDRDKGKENEKGRGQSKQQEAGAGQASQLQQGTGRSVAGGAPAKGDAEGEKDETSVQSGIESDAEELAKAAQGLDDSAKAVIDPSVDSDGYEIPLGVDLGDYEVPSDLRVPGGAEVPEEGVYADPQDLYEVPQTGSAEVQAGGAQPDYEEPVTMEGRPLTTQGPAATQDENAQTYDQLEKTTEAQQEESAQQEPKQDAPLITEVAKGLQKAVQGDETEIDDSPAPESTKQPAKETSPLSRSGSWVERMGFAKEGTVRSAVNKIEGRSGSDSGRGE